MARVAADGVQEMTEAETKVEALKIAAMRNQKLGTTPDRIVDEAKIYQHFLSPGVAKRNQGVKKKSSTHSADWT